MCLENFEKKIMQLRIDNMEVGVYWKKVIIIEAISHFKTALNICFIKLSLTLLTIYSVCQVVFLKRSKISYYKTVRNLVKLLAYGCKDSALRFKLYEKIEVNVLKLQKFWVRMINIFPSISHAFLNRPIIFFYNLKAATKFQIPKCSGKILVGDYIQY